MYVNKFPKMKSYSCLYLMGLFRSQAFISSQAKQREEAAAKKLEAKQLAAKEEAEIAVKKPAKAKSAATKANPLMADTLLRNAHHSSILRGPKIHWSVENSRGVVHLYVHSIFYKQDGQKRA
jgi:hypothetical protein